MKTYFKIAVTILTVILLSSGGLLVTHAASPNRGSNPSTQGLTLSMEGGVFSAGNQHYIINQNGPAVEAIVDGSQLVTSQLTYNLNAQQQGLSTSGNANFVLTGQDSTGATITVSGQVQIMGAMPAICFPSYSTPAVCTSLDTSEVPAAFTGVASIQVGNGPVTSVPMVLESAYMNPFGAPIILSSTDGSLLIVTPYTQATIDWSNVVDSAVATGTFGTNGVGGTFTQVASEHENLVAGTAQDHGSFAFTGMSLPSLDMSGNYHGASTIPTAGSSDCSTLFGFPANSGVCTMTGFQSAGSFQMNSPGPNPVKMSGSYDVTWDIPAVTFGLTGSATVTASVTTH